MSERATITPDTEWVLAIDFGTVNTCAAVREDGRVRVLQLEGESRMPSAIFREPDGRILVGRAAERRALLDPDRFEGTPKRYLEVGREGLLLGDAYVPLREAVGAILRAVYEEACRQHGGRRPAEVRLTHPVDWREDRRRLLLEAAAEAGIEEPMLLSEPEGALVHLARLDGGAAPGQGSLSLVYDLGGGTFDCAVLRRRGNRFQLIGLPGGDERIGGAAFDDHLLAALGEQGLPPRTGTGSSTARRRPGDGPRSSCAGAFARRRRRCPRARRIRCWSARPSRASSRPRATASRT